MSQTEEQSLRRADYPNCGSDPGTIRVLKVASYEFRVLLERGFVATGIHS